MELVRQIIIFGTVATFIATASGQCPSGCFCLAGYVTCSRLTSLPPSFPEDTRAIIINNIVLDEIPAGIFNKLPALETIEIYLGTVGKIATGAFDSLTYLDSIGLNELRIGVIEPYAFHNITDIGTLSLCMSEIETIQSYAFWDIFALDEIKLFMLNVTTIESFAISNVDELYRFSFYTNNIRSLQPYAFTNITNVHKLSLYLNHFANLGCGSIEPLLAETYGHSFYSNSVTCSCDLAWISYDPVLKNHLFSNWCQVPNTDEKIYWEDISTVILECSSEQISECPPISLFEFTQATDASKLASTNYIPLNTVHVSVASTTRETVTTAPKSSSNSTEESLLSSETTATSSTSVTSESLLSSETTTLSTPSSTSESLVSSETTTLSTPSSTSESLLSSETTTFSTPSSTSESLLSSETTTFSTPSSTSKSLLSSETPTLSTPSVTSESLLSSEPAVSSSLPLTSETVPIPYSSSLPSSPTYATKSTKVPILSRETTGIPGPKLSDAPTIQNVSHAPITRTSTLKPDSATSKVQSTTNVNIKLKDVISGSTKRSSDNFHHNVVISNKTVNINAVTVHVTHSSTERKHPQKISFPKEDGYINSAAHVSVYWIGVTFALCFSVMCTSVNVNL